MDCGIAGTPPPRCERLVVSGVDTSCIMHRMVRAVCVIPCREHQNDHCPRLKENIGGGEVMHECDKLLYVIQVKYLLISLFITRV